MSRSGDLNPGLLRDSPKLYHWATDELILNRLKKVVNKLSAAFHTNRKIKMRISPKGPDNFFCTLPIWNRYYPSFNLAYNSNESSKVFCPYNSHSLCMQLGSLAGLRIGICRIAFLALLGSIINGAMPNLLWCFLLCISFSGDALCYGVRHSMA